MKMMQTICLIINSLFVIILFSGCSSNRSSLSNEQGSSTLDMTFYPGNETNLASEQTTSPITTKETSRPFDQVDYRQEMRDFVIGLSTYAKSIQPGFAIVTQNGEDIIASGSTVHDDFLEAIDGIGREDFLFGYNDDNITTPTSITKYIRSYLNIYKTNGKTILITDYCFSTDKMQRSYDSNSLDGFISFAADERELNRIPSYPQPIFNENANNIVHLSKARNFLYLINPEHYASKTEFINALKKTNYDLIIVDLFFHDSPLSSFDVEQLKVKSNGATRQVICYLSIGEAETYRYYWQDDWTKKPPVWLDQENPEWQGNYKVRYWDPAWQSIIFGNGQSYLDMILSANFDGVYLDIIDAFEFFEAQ